MDETRSLADGGEGAQGVISQSMAPRFAEQVLPEEMWERIAEAVLEGSAEDHRNFVNSSPYFQDLRASHRTTTLFEQVLPLVAASVWEKEGLEGFPVSDVLKCREVCKHWNTAVQKVVPEKFACSGKSFFGEGANSQEFEDIGRIFERIEKNCWLGDDRTGERRRDGAQYSVNRFLNHFGETHGPTYRSKRRNPFFCPKIYLKVIGEAFTPADYERHVQGIDQIVSTYGTQVDIFRVKSDVIQFFERVLPLMPKWLALLPNLKKFELIDKKHNDVRELNLDAAVSYPLPQLQRLEKIRICSGVLPMWNQLVRQNTHVSELWLENPEQYDIFTLSFPNLKTLSLRKCQGDFALLFSSKQFQWPVETLVLGDVDFFEGYPRLFQAVRDKFAETLVSMKIELDPCQRYFFDQTVWVENEKVGLALPKLKEIQISYGGLVLWTWTVGTTFRRSGWTRGRY